jgi:hypothetical protein
MVRSCTFHSEQEAKAKVQDEMGRKVNENKQLQQRVASLGRQMADADGCGSS